MPGNKKETNSFIAGSLTMPAVITLRRLRIVMIVNKKKELFIGKRFKK